MTDQKPSAQPSKRTLDDMLDAALAASFPASDPVAISIDHALHATNPKQGTSTQAVKGSDLGMSKP